MERYILNESSDLKFNLHAKLEASDVNGPGSRFVIWLQGCPFACKGCFNPHTWEFSNKNRVSVSDLACEILFSNTDGLTISGGEPFSQVEALLEFLKCLHTSSGELGDKLPRGIICFTGNLIEDLDETGKECLKYIDLLIDGRYVEQLRYPSGLAGSSNQRFHFNSNPGRGEALIKKEEVLFDQAIEIHVDDDDMNLIKVTGFPSINTRWLKEQGLTIENEVFEPKNKV